MRKGKIKFYNHSNGFGFIISENENQEVFFHRTDIIEEINQNDQVTFEVAQGKKGLKAINVKKI